MAHESSYEQTPYPQQHVDYGYTPLPDERYYQPGPQSLAPPYHQTEDPYRPRSRASSSAQYHDPSFPPPPPTAIYNAVNSAFDNSSAANQLPHDIINQITEQVRSQVLDSLRAETLAQFQQHAPPAPPPQPSFTTPQPQPYIPTSPISSSTNASRPVHTPPSPARGSSNDSSLADHDARYHRDSRQAREESRERMRKSWDSVADPIRETAATNKEGDGHRESVRQSVKIDLSNRTGDRSEDERSRTRPPPGPRSMTDEEETVIEKMWQPLFDSEGQPTPRLGQFLRGLALHLIEDYEPTKSLVISPAKMQRFYEETKLTEETYPWHTIFSRLSSATIGKIYRDLRCAHHYIQTSIAEPPHVPALTPEGFQTWMTIMIQAHPGSEFDRLAKAVRDMPISNADDRKERLPKELSRRLFPRVENAQQRLRCAAALQADGQVPPPRHTSFPPPPPNEPPPNNIERERTPYGRDSERHRESDRYRDPERSYSKTDSSAVQDLDDDLKPTIQLERERKPYTAKEGTGKIYDDNVNSSASTLKPSDPMRTRAASTAVDGSYQSGSAFRAPPPGVSSTPSAPESHSHHHHRTYSKSSGRRPKSPSLSSYAKSDGNITDIPSAYYTSNIYSDPDEEPRHRDRERERERERDRDRGDRHRDRDDDWSRLAAEEELQRKYSRESRREPDDYPHRHHSSSIHSSSGTNGYPSGYGSSYNPGLGSGERRYG